MNNQIALKDLALFCMVARAASFAAVARSEGVSPAFISKRIALLERALQVTLLHRTTRTVTLTADGRTVLEWSQKIVDDVEHMAEAVADTAAAPRGLLRISSSSGFGRNRLGPALSDLVTRYPTLSVQLELVDRPVDVVSEGFDLDIRLGGTPEPDLLSQRLAGNARVLCAAPGYLAAAGAPRKLADLAAHRCICIRERDQPFGLWRLMGPRGPETVRVAGPLSANNGEVVHQWGVAGHGIFLRSQWDVAEELRDGRLIQVLPEYSQAADVYAIHANRLDASGRLRATVQFLREWFTEHPLDR